MINSDFLETRKIGVFDLGTNSLLLLIGEVKDPCIQIMGDYCHTPRIGEQFLQNNQCITEKALQRTCKAVQQLKCMATDCGVREFYFLATSAVRESKNQQQVVKTLSEISECEIDVLSWEEEARLTYLSVARQGFENKSLAVVDIGGGSTEVIQGRGSQFQTRQSFNMGVVKLLDQCQFSLSSMSEAMELARQTIHQQIKNLTLGKPVDHFIGTAGTFTHIASMHKKVLQYNARAIDQSILSYETIQHWIEQLQHMPLESIVKLPGVDPRRADVLIPGLLIVEGLFQRFRNNCFVVLDRGIRFGKLFDVLGDSTSPICFSCDKN